jgi:hypothetical protein
VEASQVVVAVNLSGVFRPLVVRQADGRVRRFAPSARVARSGQQVLEDGRSELPSEGPGGRVVTPLEGGEPVFDLVKAGEVVGKPKTRQTRQQVIKKPLKSQA